MGPLGIQTTPNSVMQNKTLGQNASTIYKAGSLEVSYETRKQDLCTDGRTHAQMDNAVRPEFHWFRSVELVR